MDIIFENLKNDKINFYLNDDTIEIKKDFLSIIIYYDKDEQLYILKTFTNFNEIAKKQKYYFNYQKSLLDFMYNNILLYC